MNLLDVENLKVRFKTPDGIVKAVNDISFSLKHGETLGIVGESGSGKSQTAFAITGLLANNGTSEGKVMFEGNSILNLPESKLNRIRAKQIAIIFQDPMRSLNPYMKISKQLMETLVIHTGASKKEAYNQSIQMLDAVKIPEAKKRMNMYPHELSGGMAQRVIIAMALLCKPKLLIGDEPTTALDVTVQAQIMKLLNELQHEFNTSIILITHDLGVIAGNCKKVMVMYAGTAMEYTDTQTLFKSAQHPYSQDLLKVIPRIDAEAGESELPTIPGNPPNLLHLAPGCPYNPRCSHVSDQCSVDIPEYKIISKSHCCACHKVA